MADYLENFTNIVYDGLPMEGYVLDLQGWVNQGFFLYMREALEDMINAKKGERINIIEVGSWKGQSTLETAFMAEKLGAKIHLVAVDTWLGSPEFYTDKVHSDMQLSLKKINGYPTLYFTFVRNIKAYGKQDVIVPLPLPSDQAYEVLRKWDHKADIVYIDAAHEEDPVYKDICHYWELLNPGGHMIGDDWPWDGVSAAVKRFSAERGVKYSESGMVWLMKKPQV